MESGGRFGVFLGDEDHFGVGVVVHDTGVAAPADHGLQDLLGVVVREGDGDVLDDFFGVGLLVDFEVGEDDVEEAELVDLLGEDFFAALAVGGAEFFAEGGEADVVLGFWGGGVWGGGGGVGRAGRAW
jgi:hypothetical protein